MDSLPAEVLMIVTGYVPLRTLVSLGGANKRQRARLLADVRGRSWVLTVHLHEWSAYGNPDGYAEQPDLTQQVDTFSSLRAALETVRAIRSSTQGLFSADPPKFCRHNGESWIPETLGNTTTWICWDDRGDPHDLQGHGVRLTVTLSHTLSNPSPHDILVKLKSSWAYRRAVDLVLTGGTGMVDTYMSRGAYYREKARLLSVDGKATQDTPEWDY